MFFSNSAELLKKIIFFHFKIIFFYANIWNCSKRWALNSNNNNLSNPTDFSIVDWYNEGSRKLRENPGTATAKPLEKNFYYFFFYWIPSTIFPQSRLKTTNFFFFFFFLTPHRDFFGHPRLKRPFKGGRGLGKEKNGFPAKPTQTQSKSEFYK